MAGPLRCVNIDWLEVFAYEPVDCPHTPDYFRECGFCVRERDYGTRVYAEMFILEDNQGEPFIEVRRRPKSDLTCGGILPPNSSHIRLVNRYCYHEHAAQLMKQFLERYQYSDVRISRIDIALDFIMFDSGDMPEKFIDRFMKGRYCKINQANIHSHGKDSWGSRVWNSIKWGSPKSQVSTKLYNKTLELRQVKDKPYVRQAWFECNLIADYHDPLRVDSAGESITPDVWRIEFSLASSVKGWYTIEEYGDRKKLHSYRNNLDCYDGRQALWKVWASLCDHYFHFKYYQEGVRKDKCPDKKLFNLLEPADIYHVERLNSAAPASTELRRLIRALIHYRETQIDPQVIASINALLKKLNEELLHDDVGFSFTREQIYAMQLAIAAKIKPLSWVDFVRSNIDDVF